MIWVLFHHETRGLNSNVILIGILLYVTIRKSNSGQTDHLQSVLSEQLLHRSGYPKDHISSYTTRASHQPTPVFP
jgi:hypothetical protein